MGSSEDRASLREQERLAAAANVTEMLIPGYGIWTVSGVKELLEERERSSEVSSIHRRELTHGQNAPARQLDEGWVVQLNDGRCWGKTEGKWVWRAWVGSRVIEGCEVHRSDAEREARNTKRQLVAESVEPGA